MGETFREEARELLGELEIALIELEEHPNDPEAVDRVFRLLHTLKGSGAMAGFEEVAAETHEFETLFERVRAGDLKVDKDLVSRSLKARDRLQRMIESGSAGADPDRLFHHDPAPSRSDGSECGRRPVPGASHHAVTYSIRFRPPADIFARGINPATLLRELAHLGECRVVAQVDAVPPLADLDPERCHLYWDVILTTEADENAIRDVFIFVEDDSELEIERIEAPHLEAYGRRLGEMPVEEEGLSLAQLQSPAERQQGENLRSERQSRESAGTIRVRSDKLDALVDLVGELVTVQARLSQAAGGRADAELQAIAEEVERLSWDLRDQVLGVRMLPIGSTFSRFRRLVRDLGEELGKEVELTTQGAETELDKTVIERLYDPLVHLIRNGIDHGIEPPAARLAAGKPARGRISLTASHSGPNVLIRISDDGGGLDRQAIMAQAAAKGLVVPDAELSDKEIYALAFLPGLSTATAVTSVSGRGVGMDVVKAAVEELRGSIEIDSRPGEGTAFNVKLPLTLAIIDGLLVQIGRDRFVMPLASVEECIELTRDDEARAHGRNLVSLRDEIIPYIRLRERFETEGAAPAIEQVVIASFEGRRFGFVVDHVVGEHQTVIKALGRMYSEVKGLSGATVLGDGNVALILDLSQLIKIEEALVGQTLGQTCRRT